MKLITLESSSSERGERLEEEMDSRLSQRHPREIRAEQSRTGHGDVHLQS
jgi:hypothetical protein